ncbi:hypothetical protein ACFC8F_24895 [Streptomyces hydrogenans]|uniref:hypothetical protein n=1 Tax=Streptomyces hydrogenans TaxID=1873719 RepID=UPI0035D81FDF
MSTTARASAFAEPARPKGLQLRFLTLGGSYVDVTSINDRVKSRWYCHGCKDTSDFPAADYLSQMRKKANGHASICRAIPLT